LGSLIGKTATSTKGSSWMMQDKVMARWLGMMEVTTRAIGRQAFRTE
jgi:hypothetical protein